MIAYHQRGIIDMSTQQPVYLTVKEVAERWGVSVRTVKNRINAGLIAAIQISERGDKRIALGEIERYEQEIKVKSSNGKSPK